MKFLSAHYLWLVFLLIPLGFFVLYCARKKEQSLRAFVASNHWPQLVKGLSTSRYWLKSSLFLVACFFMIVALARPSWGQREQVYIDRGLDIMVAFDVSRSMLATDVQPNRLEHAKSRVRELMSQLPGQRIGLMPFAGDAFILSPMTSDYGFMRERLDRLSPSIILTPGTNFAQALNTARFAFNQGSVGKKILIFITDGEDHSTEFKDALAKAESDGIIIYALGLGSTTGSLLPEKGPNSKEEILSKLNPEILKEMASSTGGSAYIAREGSILDINPLALEIKTLATNSKQKNETTLSIREERFQFPLSIAFLILLIETMLSPSSSKLPLFSRRTA